MGWGGAGWGRVGRGGAGVGQGRAGWGKVGHWWGRADSSNRHRKVKVGWSHCACGVSVRYACS